MQAVHRFTTVAVATFALMTGYPEARAEEPTDGPAVLVLDGSGSMWGEIGSEKPSKFDLARGVLREQLKSLSPRVRLGLMSFGQRRRADCSDVEVLAPPEAGPMDRIAVIADRLSPKGKGPLALALKEAAKQIPAGEAGSIIVIHDGPDNCWQDPCASAAEIAKANPKARVFLIGFGLQPAELQGLQCVARTTNGRVLEARDSAGLGAALSDALTLANLERIDPASGITVPTPQAVQPQSPVGAPGLRLSAALSASGGPVKSVVQWSVLKADAPAEPAVAAARSAELAVDLPPGSYAVEARLGEAVGKATVEVKEGGPTVAKVSLGAGVLTIAGLVDKLGKPLINPLVTVSAKSGGPSRPVWVGRAGGVDLVLPAGHYQVRVEDGFAVETLDASLAEGANANVGPALGTGTLTLSATAVPSGEPVSDVIYVIEEDDPDSPAGRREVTRTAEPKPTFTLPAGTYYISARSGVGQTNDRIALGSGNTIQHVVTFNLVPLTVTAAGVDAARGGVIRILTETEPIREVARANGATATFRLPPARYRVEAEVNGLNVKSQGIVDLTSGRGGGVQLKLESGEVAIQAASQAGRHWRIEDGGGRTILHSGRADATQARLAPGRYTLISYGRDQEREQAFEIKAGERRDLAVDSP